MKNWEGEASQRDTLFLRKKKLLTLILQSKAEKLSSCSKTYWFRNIMIFDLLMLALF